MVQYKSREELNILEKTARENYKSKTSVPETAETVIIEIYLYCQNTRVKKFQK